MSANSAERALGELLDFSSGKSIAPGGDGLYPVFGSNGVIGRSNENLFKQGIIIGRVGAYCGSIAISRTPFWASDNTIVARPKTGFDLGFAYYLLSDAKLNRHAGGSAQPLLTQSTLKPLRFRVPSCPVQRRIASILGTYDDLIEINRRRIALLEEMARRLFQEWFVHFRFPGHKDHAITKTPQGPIPDGWCQVQLGSLCADVRETVDPGEIEAETPYVGLEHIPRRSTTLSSWGSPDEVTSTKLQFRKGDVLFGKIRPYFHKVVYAPFDGVSSSDAIVIRSKVPEYTGLVLSITSSDPFVAHAVATSNGTKMPRANWSVLAKTLVAMPPGRLLRKFNDAVFAWAEFAALLNSTNVRLAAARDLLLPRLISGELRVSAAERELEAAE